jgi:uncharacterized membrane protein
MIQKVLDFFNNTFGSAGKWVLLGVAGVALIIGIILVVFVMKNLWVVLGVGAGVVALVGAGFVVYNKFIKKDTTTPTTTN